MPPTSTPRTSFLIVLAMLVMEAAFGIPGVIAAPIFYAYIKRELLSAKLTVRCHIDWTDRRLLF